MACAAVLLERLGGVKSTGHSRWIARCPAHADRSPSLTLRELPDGRVLLHCFAGCETEAVLDAIGLTFADLFPEPLTREHLPRLHAPFSALEALKCLTHESGIVAICASDLAEGKPLSAIDADRVALAAGRIASALEAVHG
jgi:hypothetical protein